MFVFPKEIFQSMSRCVDVLTARDFYNNLLVEIQGKDSSTGIKKLSNYVATGCYTIFIPILKFSEKGGHLIQ